MKGLQTTENIPIELDVKKSSSTAGLFSAGVFRNKNCIILVLIEGWATCATIRHVFQQTSTELTQTNNSNASLTHTIKNLISNRSSHSWLQKRKKIPCAWPLENWQIARMYIPDDTPPPDVIELVHAKLAEQTNESEHGWRWDLYSMDNQETETRVIFVRETELIAYEIAYRAFRQQLALSMGLNLQPIPPPRIDELTVLKADAENLVAAWKEKNINTHIPDIPLASLETAAALALFAMLAAQPRCHQAAAIATEIPHAD